MKQGTTKLSFAILLGIALSACKPTTPALLSANNSYARHVVDKHGALRADGTKIVDKNGQPIQLRGMSLFWSQWAEQYWNESVIQTLTNDWKINVIRAPIGVEMGGYLENPNKHKDLIKRVVQAAIASDIYVIVDWHAHYAHKETDRAIEFFSEFAKTYGQNPHVIFEIFNEPKDDVTWDEVKAYADSVIKAIRDAGSKNLIVVGTVRWSQNVDEAAYRPLEDMNVAYALHFYATSHRQELRDRANRALAANIPLFVTEFGVCEASGDGPADFAETDRWIAWMDEHKISWANWSINDKPETASALVGGASSTGNWDDSKLTESGKYVKRKLLEAAARDGGNPNTNKPNPQQQTQIPPQQTKTRVPVADKAYQDPTQPSPTDQTSTSDTTSIADQTPTSPTATPSQDTQQTNTIDCKQYNRDGLSCSQVGVNVGEEKCVWNEKWTCTNGCADWISSC